MPLIPCPECQAQVSTSAVSCPKCGYPIAGGAMLSPPLVFPPSSSLRGWVVLLAAVLLVVVGMGLTNPSEARFRDELEREIPGFKIAAGINDALKLGKCKYSNYLLFSTMSLVHADGREENIGYGVLGHISLKPIKEWD